MKTARAQVDCLYARRAKTKKWMSEWQALAESMHHKKYPYVVRYILNSGDASICDVGCGTGFLLQSLRKKGFRGRLVGIDINLSDVLQDKSKKYQIELLKTDFKKLRTIKCDGIIFFSALHYVTPTEVRKIIDNLRPNNFYITEAFQGYPENLDLEKRVAVKTNNKCHLFGSRELDLVFGAAGYKVCHRHRFSRTADRMRRIFTFVHYCSKNKKRGLVT